MRLNKRCSEPELPSVSAERLDCLFIGLACHARQRRVPVTELFRYVSQPS